MEKEDTIYELGDKETFEALISDTLEDFTDSTVSSISGYPFERLINLKTVNLPACTNILNNEFMWDINLQSVNMDKLQTFNTSFPACVRLKELNVSPELSQLSYVLNMPFIGVYTLKKPSAGVSISGYGPQGLVFPNTVINNGNYTAYNLSTLVLPSTTPVSLNTTTFYPKSPLDSGQGYIYVPEDLISTYVSATNWSKYASQFVSIDEYPKEFVGGTITDSWDEIFEAEDNGTYSTKYSIGDTKVVGINGGAVMMRIIAMDADEVAGSSDTAKITWLSVGTYIYSIFNDFYQEYASWGDSDIRLFYNNTVYPTVQENVRQRILCVNKSYKALNISNETFTSTDYMWVPSYREMQPTAANNSVEDVGPRYSYFADNASRKLFYGPCGTQGTYTGYGLRTMGIKTSRNQFSLNVIATTGGSSQTTLGESYAFPIGFCT